MTTEQETLEKLRAHFYVGREPEPEPESKPKPASGQAKVKLDDLADFLARHPTWRIPKGEPMTCAGCQRTLQGGEFRAHFRAGWFCRYCYKALALAPVGARCIYCKEKIRLDVWDYRLWSVTIDNGALKSYHVHQKCGEEMERLQKAA